MELAKFLKSFYNKCYFRKIILKNLAKHGENFRLGYSTEFVNPQYFEIGANFYSGPYCYFATNKYVRVFIDDDVMFGPYCKVIGGNHDLYNTSTHIINILNPIIEYHKIIIEKGVWVGANSVILTKSHISEGAIIGALSLVTNYIPPYTIAVGNPAKRIRKRFENPLDLKEILKNVNSKYTFDEINQIYQKYDIGYND